MRILTRRESACDATRRRNHSIFVFTIDNNERDGDVKRDINGGDEGERETGEGRTRRKQKRNRPRAIGIMGNRSSPLRLRGETRGRSVACLLRRRCRRAEGEATVVVVVVVVLFCHICLVNLPLYPRTYLYPSTAADTGAHDRSGNKDRIPFDQVHRPFLVPARRLVSQSGAAAALFRKVGQTNNDGARRLEDLFSPSTGIHA